MPIKEHLWPGEQIIVSVEPFHATDRRLLRIELAKRREYIESLKYGEIGSVIRQLRIRKQTVLLGVAVAFLAFTVGPPGFLKLLFAMTGLFGALAGLLNRFVFIEIEGWNHDQMTRIHWILKRGSTPKVKELIDVVDAAMAAGLLAITPNSVVQSNPNPIPLRSVLILPADRPDQLQPALALNPDALCLDLWTTVAQSKRTLAQQFVWSEIVAASKTTIPVLVRISDSAAIEELEMSIWAGIWGVIAPFKNCEEVYQLEKKLIDLELTRGLPPTIKLLPYVESTDISVVKKIIESSPRIEAIILGSRDLTKSFSSLIPEHSLVEPADLTHTGVQCLGLLGTDIAPESFRKDVETFEGLLLYAAQQANSQGYKGALTPHPQGVVAASNAFSGS